MTLTLVLLAFSMSLAQASLFGKISVQYPERNLNGQPLFIRGDSLGLNWDQGVKLQHTDRDQWTWTFQYSSSDVGKTLSFKTLVADSTWQIGHNDQIVLSGTSDMVYNSYPFFASHEGRYQVTGTLHSNELKNDRDVIVYFPPSYDENTNKVFSNVLIMHDGENLFNDSTSFGGVAWRCQDTINRLVNEGSMQEILVVGLYNTAARIDEYTYSYDPSVMEGGQGDSYLDFIESTAIPWIKKNLRISDDVRLGIMGSSLGGLISCYAGWTRPSVYSIAGCMSSSFWWNNQDFNTTILNKARPPQKPQTVFYLDSGDQGDSQDDKVETITVRKHFESLGWVLGSDLYYYLMRGGSHNERSWGERFHVPMTALYPPQPLAPAQQN